MGGFFYISKDTPLNPASALDTSRAQFRASGFPSPVTIEDADSIIDYYPKILEGRQNLIRFSNGDFIIAVGTLLYRGRIGPEAARLLYAESDPASELALARGHFAIVLRKNGVTRLFHDLLGSYEVFHAPHARLITTSFLAAAACSPTRTLEVQAAYEYVFTGASLGNTTPFVEIRRLALDEAMELSPIASSHCRPIEICPHESTLSRSELITRNVEGLIEYAGELANLFGNNIQLALSGGYDTRLLFALFRRVGVTPHLFVYGNRDAQDVLIAKEIAAAEGIPLRHINKDELCHIGPGEYSQTIEANFHHEDGLPWGGIFSNGAEMLARLQRNEGGALHVNGGGGEIFRNFFYLLDHDISPREFVWIFYSRFDPAECTKLFESGAYERSVAAKVGALMPTNGGKLSRRQIESLYPYFRCRAWFGRENSVNNRWGYSVLPFFDYRTVAQGLQIPIRYKHFGNFEGAMIRAVDSALATYRTNYGHNFVSDAPAPAVLRQLMTYLRPPRLRRYSFRLKERFRARRPRTILLTPAYLRRVIDPELPFLSRLFRIDHVTSNEHFARMCTLEYLLHRFPASIPDGHVPDGQTT